MSQARSGQGANEKQASQEENEEQKHIFLQNRGVGMLSMARIDPFRQVAVLAAPGKVTGSDWKKKSLFTLRHSAGCDKYTKLDKKESKKPLSIENLYLRVLTLEKQLKQLSLL